MLLNLNIVRTGIETFMYVTDNLIQSARIIQVQKLVIINNTNQEQRTGIETECGLKDFTLHYMDRRI